MILAEIQAEKLSPVDIFVISLKILLKIFFLLVFYFNALLREYFAFTYLSITFWLFST